MNLETGEKKVRLVARRGAGRPVAVVTGASAGLGRATAIELAHRGFDVVIGARREQALTETARLCHRAGASAHWHVTDVTEEGDVRRLAKYAEHLHGRVDVWVNNAGVTLFAPLEEAPFSEHRRVIETNLFGAMLGARAVVPIFRAQGWGTLINVSSILGKIGHPFVPSYVISKFGVRGLSEALRVELADMPDVHVCTVYPYAIDTPHFQEGANRVGFHPRAMPPVQSPEEVARVIGDVALRPRRERHIPRLALLGLWAHELMPRTVERLLLEALVRWHFDENRQERTAGNLNLPSDELPAAVHGDRGPQLTPLGFSVWAAYKFSQLEAQALARLLGLAGAIGGNRARRPTVARAEPSA